MHRHALVLTVFTMFVALSGCSSSLGGLLDAAGELGSPELDVKALATAEDIDCPPLPDPNAPVNVYICQIFARVDYLLGLITCAEYQTQYAACTPT